MTRAVVIGGGPVGLSTTVLLARGGLEVTLCERHPHFGGRSAPLNLRSHVVDPSPWFLCPESYADFFSLVGRRLDDYLDLLEPEVRFRTFYEEAPDSPAQALDLDVDTPAIWGRFEEVSPGDGEASRRLVLMAAQRHQVILKRLGGAPYLGPSSFLRLAVVRHLVWCAGIMMRSLGREITATVHHPHIRQILEFPALALTGTPETTPVAHSSAYVHHLCGAIRYPRGGFGSVIAALEKVAREEGARLRTNSDVARILVDPETRLASGVVLRTGEVIAADLVVSCVDPHHTETALLTDGFRSRPPGSWDRLQASPSMLVAVFGVKKRLPQLAHHNLFFPRNGGRALTGLDPTPIDDPLSSGFVYVGRPTATDPALAPKGKESIVLIVPLPADPSLGAAGESRQALLSQVSRLLRQVGAMAGIPDLEGRSQAGEVLTPADFAEKYSTWRGSGFGIAPTFHGLTRPCPRGASRRVRNLFYPGSSLFPHPGIPGAFDSALATAKLLLGRTDNEPLDAPIEPGFLRETRRRDAVGHLLRTTTRENSLDDD
ncbi:MAG: phytoene desaturase [Demequinaceae bacterium]|nr:phytoene desaturase [Demequinaceae bacterium]